MNKGTVPNDMVQRWYDDWLLSMGAASGGGYYVKVELPRCPTQKITYISGNISEIKKLANLLDKLLCELTGTKTMEVVDGRTAPTRD